MDLEHKIFRGETVKKPNTDRDGVLLRRSGSRTRVGLGKIWWRIYEFSELKRRVCWGSDERPGHVRNRYPRRRVPIWCGDHKCEGSGFLQVPSINVSETCKVHPVGVCTWVSTNVTSSVTTFPFPRVHPRLLEPGSEEDRWCKVVLWGSSNF